MASTMAMLRAKDMVDELDQLSIDNLRCGRITKEAMQFAMRELSKINPSALENYIPAGLCCKTDYQLADILNDMLEAGRECF
jgi:hypothetical protein